MQLQVAPRSTVPTELAEILTLVITAVASRLPTNLQHHSKADRSVDLKSRWAHSISREVEDKVVLANAFTTKRTVLVATLTFTSITEDLPTTSSQKTTVTFMLSLCVVTPYPFKTSKELFMQTRKKLAKRDKIILFKGRLASDLQRPEIASTCYELLRWSKWSAFRFPEKPRSKSLSKLSSELLLLCGHTRIMARGHRKTSTSQARFHPLNN